MEPLNKLLIMSNPLISIIILNWNGIIDTLFCLQSLEYLTYVNFNVIVVDNGSTDDSIQKLNEYNPNYSLTLITTGYNLGFAEGNNVGIRHALELNPDFIFLLNNDTKVRPNILEELIKSSYNNATSAIFGALIFYMDNPQIIWFSGAQWNKSNLAFEYPYQNQEILHNFEYKTEYACGAALFFRANLVEKIGLFDERFFLVYEESDWCLRAVKAGYKCTLVPTAHVWHKVGASFDGESSPLRQYFSFRNRLLWAEKNLTFGNWLNLLLKSFIIFFPTLHVPNISNGQFLKHLYWSILSYKKNWQDPSLIAKRQGLVDYICRSFGNCPEKIRLLNNKSIK